MKIQPDYTDRGWNVYVVREKVLVTPRTPTGTFAYEYKSRRLLSQAELMWRHNRHLKKIAERRG